MEVMNEQQHNCSVRVRGKPLRAIYIVKGLTLPEGAWFLASDVCEMLDIVNVGDVLTKLKSSQKKRVRRINIVDGDVNTKRGNPNVGAFW